MSIPSMLRLSRRQSPVTVLGPGSRAVLWVQGCRQSCPGCITPESQDESGGQFFAIEEIADWIRSCAGIEGVTVSGGEPFLQAEPLLELMSEIADLTLGWMVYSGYTLEWLQQRGTVPQKELLARIDLLVDGPYLRERHADLLWRGSSNQCLIPLSGRYRLMVEAVVTNPALDRSAGIEIAIDGNGSARFVGVPPDPGFRDPFDGPDDPQS